MIPESATSAVDKTANTTTTTSFAARSRPRRTGRGESRGDPWCSGKALLAEAGAKSRKMADVFKSKPDWLDLNPIRTVVRRIPSL